MTVHFIGAGPGAPDLITLRGRDLIARCPVCLYAGSLVPQALLAHCPPGARIVDTAPLSLDEIIAEFARAARRGPRRRAAAFGRSLDLERDRRADAAADGARHPLYGHPGVPAFAAAAAALGRELTLPEVAQSLVLTRTSGRASAMPERETLSPFAATGATLAIHLSIHALDKVVAELTPHYGADCPVAIVYRASWPDERIMRGHARRRSSRRCRPSADGAHRADPGRPGACGADFRDSALYDADYQRRFRGRARMIARTGIAADQFAVAVEHHDLQRSRAIAERCSPPSATRRARPRRRPGRSPAACACPKAAWRCWRARDRSTSGPGAPAPRASASQPRSTSPRRECRSSRPWPSLVILATPPAMVTRATGWRAQIFQHAADEIAHVDQRRLRQAVKLLHRRFRGRCRSRRRYASGPRRGRRRCRDGSSGSRRSRNTASTIPVVPRIDRPPTMPSRPLSVRSASSSPPGIEISTSTSPRPVSARPLRRSPRAIICARHRVDRGLAGRQRQAGPGHGADALAGAEDHARRRRAAAARVAITSAPWVTSGSSPASLTTPAARIPRAMLLHRQRESRRAGRRAARSPPGRESRR